MAEGPLTSSPGRHLRNVQPLVFTAVSRPLCYDAAQVAGCLGGAMTTALRPLSTGELLDRAFSLYRSHFGLFVGIFALPHLAVLAAQFLQVINQRSYGRMPNFVATMLWLVTIWFVNLIMAAASQAAAVIAVSELHLDRPAGVMDSFARVKGHLLGVIGISIIAGLGIAAGTAVLVIPGILLAIIWSLSVPAKVLEDKGPLA